MATNQTLNAQFTNNDALTLSAGRPVGGFLLGGRQRIDTYNLTVSGAGSVDISPPSGGFVAYDPSGTVIGSSATSATTTIAVSAGVDYQIQAQSLVPPSLPQNYTLEADVTSGDVTLAPTATAFTGTQTGASIVLPEQLDSRDPVIDIIGLTNSTPVDEFQLDTSQANEVTEINVVSTSAAGLSFDPYVEVINSSSGQVVGADDDSGTGLNSQLFVQVPAGADYRVRVSDALGRLRSDTASYELQANVNSGTVSLTPRKQVPVVNADDPTLVPGNSITRPRPSEYEQIDKTTSPSNFDVFFLSEGNDNYDLADAPPPTEPPMGVVANDRFVIGLEGDDTLTGTANRDFPATGNQGADRFDLMAGPDVALGGKDSDVLNGGDGDDQLGGNRGIDRVDGGNGDDTLLGGQGEDLILGRNGDDVLIGDVGKDILIGGADRDTFILRTDAEGAADAIADADVIVDFNAAEDNLALQGATFADVNLQAATVVRNNTVSSATAIQLNATGEYLGIVSGVEPSAIDASNFVAAPF